MHPATRNEHLFKRKSDLVYLACTPHPGWTEASANRKFQEGNPIASTNYDRYIQCEDCERLFHDVKPPAERVTTGIYAQTKFPRICRKCIVSTTNGSLPASARRDNGPVTSPTLVRRLQSWEDTTAWRLFADQYNHLFEKWSQSKLRNPADVDELNQQVLWEMARRITRFQYDPTKSFRGWLRTLHHSRLLDFLKVEKRRLAHDKQAIQVRSQAQQACLVAEFEEESLLESSEKETPGVFDRALTIRQRVQDRVSVQTWTIFSEIAINGQSIADTAKRHEMRYASAFAAYSRVCRMLRQEANA